VNKVVLRIVGFLCNMCVYIFSFATQSDATVVLYKCGIVFSGKDMFMKNVLHKYRMSEKYCTFFLFFFLGAQCVESGVSCTDCY
jgi:hypothetical protein